MSYEKVLTSDEFDIFIRGLSILRDNCNDVDIKDGFIRERTDRQTSIFMINLNSIVPDINVSFGDIKEVLDALKTFAGRDVTISVNDIGCSFSDEYSRMEFHKPFDDFIDNKFITDEEFDKIIQISEEDLVLDTELFSLLTDRIDLVGKIYQVESIQIKLEGENASLHMVTSAGDRNTKIIGDIITNKVLETNYISNIITAPFIIDHDNDINFKIYKMPEKDSILNTFITHIGDLDIKIISTAGIREEDDDE